MKKVISGLFGPTVCKYCHKEMKKRETCGFFNAIEVIIARITTTPFYQTQYACKGKVYNDKYDLWKEDCKKIDEKNKKIKRQNRITGLFGKQKPEIPYPPRPPKKVPCPNRYCQRPFGKYNEKILGKKQIFFDNAGNEYHG